GGRQEDELVALGHGERLRGDVLGEPFGERGAVGVQHLGDAGSLGGGLRRGLAAGSGDQHGDVGAKLRGGGERGERRRVEVGVVVFGDDQCSHVVTPVDSQMILASFLSLSTSVATSGTFTPAARAGGSLTLRVLSRGVTSTPRSAGVTTSSCFFFAFMMFGSVT